MKLDGYKRQGSTGREELFIARICTGVLNVCSFEERQDGLYSIPFEEGQQKNVLTIAEILADMSLFSLLFEKGNYYDRNIVPSDDYRNKHGETISGNNCRVYQSGTYSIFDIIPDINRDIGSEESILEELFYIIESLYMDVGESISLGFFSESGIIDVEYSKRIINRCEKFLDFFGSDSGEEVFKRTHKEATGNIHSKIVYDNFIKNIQLILDTFRRNHYALQDFIDESSKIRSRRLKYLLKEVCDIIKSSVSSSLGRS